MTRSPRRAAVALVIALACLAALLYMSGCASYPTQYPHQPPVTAQLNDALGPMTIRIKWFDSVDAIAEECGTPNFRQLTWTYGCALPSQIHTGVNGLSRECFIRALKPRSFNDEVPLKILGHELAHCYSMRH